MENKQTKQELIKEGIETAKQSIINGEHNLAINQAVLKHLEKELAKCPAKIPTAKQNLNTNTIQEMDV